MAEKKKGEQGLGLPILQGVLPIKGSQIPTEIIAGITLAALAVPEVMGYTKIAGTPVITGLYTILIPMALFALFGSSRHLVVGADSATAAILAAGLVGLAATGSDEYVALAAVLAFMAAGFLILARIVGLGFLADFLSRTVLAGFLTGVGLIDIAGMWQIYAQARPEFWVALITAAVVVFVGVEQGILLAMFLSLIDHTRKGYRPRNRVIFKADKGGWRTQPVANPSQYEPGLLVYRFSHSM